MKTVITVLVFCVTCSAVEKPKHTAYWVLTAAAGTLEALDVGTTLRNLSAPGGYENNPLLGRHPGPARVILTSSALSAGWFLASRHAEMHGHPRAARLMMAASIALEGECVQHNFAHGPQVATPQPIFTFKPVRPGH